MRNVAGFKVIRNIYDKIIGCQFTETMGVDEFKNQFPALFRDWNAKPKKDS